MSTATTRSVDLLMYAMAKLTARNATVVNKIYSLDRFLLIAVVYIEWMTLCSVFSGGIVCLIFGLESFCRLKNQEYQLTVN